MRDQELWIGLAEVKRLPGNDVFANPYAFVPVIAYASNPLKFRALVQRQLAERRLELLRLQDVEMVSERRKKHTLPDELEDAIGGLNHNRRVALGGFHTFPR